MNNIVKTELKVLLCKH